MKRLPFLLMLASIALITVPQIGLAQTATAEKPLSAETQVEAEQTNQVKDKLMPAEIRRGKTRLRVGEGENLFWFKKQTESSCKLYGSDEKEVAAFSFKGKTLKAKSSSGEDLFEVKPKDQKVMILDAKTGKELFKLKLKLADGKIDFYLPNNKRVYRIKKKDYGWRLEDKSGNTLFRAKRPTRPPRQNRSLFQGHQTALAVGVLQNERVIESAESSVRNFLYDSTET